VSRAAGKGIKATHIRKTILRKSKTWLDRTIYVNLLWWFAQTIPMTRKAIAYPR
jgi:hypothetical protein